jgi:hypothetical protein
MRLRHLAAATALLLATRALPAAGASTIYIAMDGQINMGSGDAILPGSEVPISFEEESGDRFTRAHLVLKSDGFVSGYGAPIVDLVRAGFGPVDMSGPGSLIMADVRYFQAAEDYPVGTPWNEHDAPIGVALSSANGTRQFQWPYHSEHLDPPYPTWTHIVIDANVPAPPNLVFVDDPTFDPHAVIQVSFFGTDWPGKGNDFVDVKALTLLPVPEPASALLMLCGAAGLGVLARRRR